MKMLELLSDETKWTKNASAKNKDGFIVGPHNPEACKWCLSGAFAKCYFGILEPEEILVLWNKIVRASVDLYQMEPVTFNDNSQTTFAQIRELLEEVNL